MRSKKNLFNRIAKNIAILVLKIDFEIFKLRREDMHAISIKSGCPRFIDTIQKRMMSEPHVLETKTEYLGIFEEEVEIRRGE